jgi:integrase
VATIYKRGQVYWARAQRSGREFRQSLKTGNRRAAEKRLQEWLDDLEAASWGDRPRIAFATAVKTFIIEYLPTLKPGAAKRYGVSLKWLGDKFGSGYLHEIGREELNSFEGWRRAIGASNPTIRRDLACLSSLFTFCEDKEWIDDGKNPVPGYMRRRAKRGLVEAPGRKRYLSEAEEEKLLSQATPAVRMAIMVAIDTGLRDQEQFTLTWPQINFQRGIIRTTTDTKNGRSRTVPLPERSAQVIAQIQAQQRFDKIATLNVFAHEDGTRILRQVKGLKAAAKRAKISDLRWHDLRRTAGCRWLQRDKRSMEEVCKLLGQSSVAVTEKSYAFLEEETVAAQVAAQKPAHRPVGSQRKRSKTKGLPDRAGGL